MISKTQSENSKDTHTHVYICAPIQTDACVTQNGWVGCGGGYETGGGGGLRKKPGACGKNFRNTFLLYFGSLSMCQPYKM